MRYSTTAILLSFAICSLNAQTHIGKDVVIAGEAMLATNASITDDRTSTQKLDIVSLKGNSTLRLAGDWIVNDFKVDGIIMLDGNITMTESMLLLNGEIEPTVSSQLLLDASASAVSENQAFVNGALYRRGHGELFFPVGKNGQYAPITYLEVPVENSSLYGIEAFDHELVFESPPNEILQISNEIHWKVLTGIPDSPVQMMLTPIVKQLATGEDILTILQANEGLTEVVNLGASAERSTIRSNKPFTGIHLLVGVQSNNVLSVDEHKIASIYPNPFTAELNIVAVDERFYRLKIYDTSGIVIQECMLDGKKTLNTSSYPSGVYLLVFYSRSGNVVTRKMVKQ
jgi:hypothetical protein